MNIYNADYKNLVIITLQKTTRVDLPITINESVKNDIKFIINSNKSVAEYKIEHDICRLSYEREYVYEYKKGLIRKFKLYIK